MNHASKKPLLVIKVGTSSVTDVEGLLDYVKIEHIAEQIHLVAKSYRIVLVSSGAVGTGKAFIKSFNKTIVQKKAAAAIGNPILINAYQRALQKYEIQVAQSLCERHHFSDKNKFLRLKETLHTLWENNIIPIANENDVISDVELKFSDNDELATLLAVGLEADRLLIGTSVDGLLDEKGKVIHEIKKINAAILSYAHSENSDLGLGGMISKLTFARLATRLGIDVTIFKTQTKDSFVKAISKEIGTFCPKNKVSEKIQKHRQDWLASGYLTTGQVKVDAGAETALKKRKSLLAVGVSKLYGTFYKGEVFDILNKNNEVIALARAKINSRELIPGKKKLEVAHADDIVIL